MTRHWFAFVLIGCLVGTDAACQARPSQRPLKTSPVTEGPNTMESVRQALQGRWVLVSLDVTAEDGRAATIDATGVLTADAFGNMSVEYRMSEAGQKQLASLGLKTPAPVISTSGNVAIDPQQHRISYVGDDFLKTALDADVAARRANPFSLERTRYYEFSADGGLTLSTRYDSGKNAAMSRWKKSS